MFRLRRLISTATLSKGADSTFARTAGRTGGIGGELVLLIQRIPARSRAAAQEYASTVIGSWATAESPARLDEIPMVPVTVQPPSGSAVSLRRRRLPPTVVAFIRTRCSTPTG